MEQFNTVADLLENAHFRSWVKNHDEERNAYWDNWLRNNPSKKDLFENALAAYLALEGEGPDLSDDAISERVLKIKQNLPEEPMRVSWWRRTEFSWAAILLIGLGTGWLLLQKEPGTALVSKLGAPVSDKAVIQDHRVVITNTNNKPMLVNLPDRSSVLLAKNSQLEYLNDAESFQRQVTLKGEAFFEIVKNPDHPFYVHTEALTTKVLGTSFLVRAFDGESRAIVRVRTGKVEVTPSTEAAVGADKVRDPNSIVQAKTLLLMPNEQASLLRKTHQLIRDSQAREQVAESPRIFDLKQFEFRFTPVTEIFAMLEKTYGTHIIYDAETFRNCTLTASLTDEPFLEKLRLICISTEASFEVSDQGIVVSGSGCK